MKLKTSGMDMLHGPLCGKLLLFTLQIALSSIVQQLFHAADTAVVGYFGSKNALAAVGTNTEIIALIVTVSAGLSVGANILIANQIGRKKPQELPAAVQTALLLAALSGMIGLFLGQAAAAPLLRLIQTPGGILDAAEQYLQIYMLGYPFLLLYDFGARRQPVSVSCTGDFGCCQCRAQSAFRDCISYGCCWGRACNRHFRHAFGAAGSAAAQTG